MENHYKVHGKARLPGVYLWKPVRNVMVGIDGLFNGALFWRIRFSDYN
jgi:hypothetical protein